jgi:hypothetical protein
MGAEGDSVFYYVLGAFYAYALSYPLAVLVLFSRWKPIRNRAHPNFELLGYLGVWALIVLVGMSIPGTKKMRYLLPIVPALSLLAAYIFIDPAPKGVLFWARRILLGFCHYALWVLMVVGWAAWPFLDRFFPAPKVYYAIAVLLLTALALAAWVLGRQRRNDESYPLIPLLGTVFALVVVVICLVNPVNQSLQETRPFVAEVESLLERQPRPLVFYQIGLDQEAMKFMVNTTRPVHPASVRTRPELLAHLGEAYLIAEEKDYKRLPPEIVERTEVLLRGRIGKRDCLVFAEQASP